MWCVWLEESASRSLTTRALGIVSRGAWASSAGNLRSGRPSRRDLPLPGGQWVRVKNHLAGIGDADLALVRDANRRTVEGALPRPKRRYLGREVVGSVAEIGPDVSLVQVGDRVTLMGEVTSTCATLGLQPPCRGCAAGHPVLCEHRALPWAGTGAGWSDEMIVHETQLFLVPSAVTNEQAVLLEPASRAVRAVLHRLPEPGAQALILGGGAQGLLTGAALQALAPGARITLATDSSFETAAARQIGIESIIPARRKQLSTRGAMLTNAQTFQRSGRTYILGGFDVVYDCQGSDESLNDALRLVHGGGLIVVVSSPVRPARIDAAVLQRDEVSLIGVAGTGNERVPDDVKDGRGGRWSSLAVAARLMRKKTLKTDTLITHLSPSAKFRDTLKLAARGAQGRVTRAVITY